MIHALHVAKISLLKSLLQFLSLPFVNPTTDINPIDNLTANKKIKSTKLQNTFLRRMTHVLHDAKIALFSQSLPQFLSDHLNPTTHINPFDNPTADKNLKKYKITKYLSTTY